MPVEMGGENTSCFSYPLFSRWRLAVQSASFFEVRSRCTERSANVKAFAAVENEARARGLRVAFRSKPVLSTVMSFI